MDYVLNLLRNRVELNRRRAPKLKRWESRIKAEERAKAYADCVELIEREMARQTRTLLRRD